jgi:predicted DNA-binding transcriptional regulator YafY
MNQLKEFKRQVEIAAFIHENPDKHSEYELCGKFRISQSTLRRDFQVLKELHVDIRSSKKRVVIDVTTKHLSTLLSSYISVCTQNNVRNLKQLRLQFKNKTISLFVDILKAINERKCLQIDYIHSDDEGTVRHVVEPIYLNPTAKSFYLIAYDNGALRFFRLEGIDTVRITSTKYNREIPQLADIYKNSWGVYSGGKEITAKLRFKKDQESYFKNRILAEEQEIKYTSGSILVELKVKLSLEFVAWVMGWGEKVEILSPDELKEQVLTNAKGLLKTNKN